MKQQKAMYMMKLTTFVLSVLMLASLAAYADFDSDVAAMSALTNDVAAAKAKLASIEASYPLSAHVARWEYYVSMRLSGTNAAAFADSYWNDFKNNKSSHEFCLHMRYAVATDSVGAGGNGAAAANALKAFWYESTGASQVRAIAGNWLIDALLAYVDKATASQFAADYILTVGPIKAASASQLLHAFEAIDLNSLENPDEFLQKALRAIPATEEYAPVLGRIKSQQALTK